MRKVIAIGETVLDIIFRNNQPIQAVPGGSAFNAIISLGRTGIPTMFIGEAGNDRVGQTIKDYLSENGVDATNVNMFPDSKSPISLAFLDDDNNAEYIFYKDHQHDQLDFVYPEVNPEDIVLFGSFFAINPVVRPQVFGFLDYARQHGAILYYDVNYRSSHRGDLMKVTPNLLENYELADIVRGSEEDFEVMYRKTDCDSIYRSEISFYTKKFIYTRGAKPVDVRSDGGFAKQYAVTPTKTVSTVGAGDNFNAGFIYGLIKYGIVRADMERGLTEEQWDQLMGCAQAFSDNCCQSLNNSIDTDFAKKMHFNLNQ
jgi:fructokinase